MFGFINRTARPRNSIRRDRRGLASINRFFAIRRRGLQFRAIARDSGIEPERPGQPRGSTERVPAPGPHVAAADRLPPRHRKRSAHRRARSAGVSRHRSRGRRQGRGQRCGWTCTTPTGNAIYLTAWCSMASSSPLDDGTIVPPDGFQPITAGPKWNQEVVPATRSERPHAPRMAGICSYIGDRPMGAARALPWIAPALPPAAGLLNARIGAAHALGTMAKISRRDIATCQSRPHHRDRRE